MHSPDNIQYALETTRVLHEPDRRIDTFGETHFEFQLISELMDEAGKVRVRTGEVEAMKPKIVKPDHYSDIEVEGFGGMPREKVDAMIEKMRAEGQDLAFLNYGFRVATRDLSEQVLSEPMESVRGRMLDIARREGNPAQVVIEGVDDAWEISVLKFTFDMIVKSWAINRFDFQRRGLL